MKTWALNCTDSFQVNLEAQRFLSHGIKLRKKSNFIVSLFFIN